MIWPGLHLSHLPTSQVWEGLEKEGKELCKEVATRVVSVVPETAWFKSWLCHLLAVCPWAGYLNSLACSFLKRKTGEVIPTSQGGGGMQRNHHTPLLPGFWH